MVVIGDYDETPAYQGLYRKVQDSEVWTEVSHLVALEFNRFIEFDDKRWRSL